MLSEVADGVLLHKSAFVQNNSIVVQGGAGVLLIDPGVHDEEMTCLANDLARLGQAVVAGFATHPHWDHLLRHRSFGDAPRFGTARCALEIQGALTKGIDREANGIPENVSIDLLGLITCLGAGTALIPWNGPEVRIFEHQAHARGHAALCIEKVGVVVAGDMLSDILIPLLDVGGSVDPIDDYVNALQLLEDVAYSAAFVIPGHGSIATSHQIHARIELDRAYLCALHNEMDYADPRFEIEYCRDWLPGVHAGQFEQLAQMTKRNAP